jgi:uncharacterized protein
VNSGRKEWTSNELIIQSIPEGISYGRILLFSSATARRVGIPIISLKGRKSGPVLGITAALHGDELNGLMVTQKIVKEIDLEVLRGIVILVPVLNIPGFEASKRLFIDDTDLNRIMPGKPKGTPSEIYAYRLFHYIITKFDMLLDLHTASFGRINSHYIRCDMSNPLISQVARILNPQIIVHTKLPKNSLRNAAITIGIPTLTIELGNPQRFQKDMILRGIEGITNVMKFIKMIPGRNVEPKREPYICEKSYWYRLERGGVLEVYPDLVQIVEKGEKIASLYDLHGRLLKEFYMPETGIIVGKSVNPVTTTGARILHIGIIGDVEWSETAKEFEIEDEVEEIEDIFDPYLPNNQEDL